MEVFIGLFALFVMLAIFLLALRGLIAIMADFDKRNSGGSARKRGSFHPGDIQRARVAREKLNELFAAGQISRETYGELRNTITARYGFRPEFPERLPFSFDDSQITSNEPASDSEIEILEEWGVEEPVTAEAVVAMNDGWPVEQQPSDDEPVAGEVLFAEIVSSPAEAAGAIAGGPREAEPALPSRTWKEMLAGFMQERNIRWGELASGILIVGSAVGLVLSLRNELRDTIPYFPALVFMLMTAAIHGAGVYTLKKWKLRNTSRGVLIIGLLLIPLNFLAGCILTGSGEQQRSLTDPVYWIAILIGISCFSVMAWFATRLLLRRRSAALFASVLFGSSWTLVLNRIEFADAVSVKLMVWSAPLLLALVAGCGLLPSCFQERRFLSGRRISRIWMQLGISLFVIACGVALLLIRSPVRVNTTVALLPVVSLAAILMAWTACVVSQSTRVLDCATELSAAANRVNRIAGSALFITGLIIAGVATVCSIANPLVLVFTAISGAILFALMAWERRLDWSWPAVWCLLTAGIVGGVNILAGSLPGDALIYPQQFVDALLSGRSGITLLVCGAVTILSTRTGLFARRTEDRAVTPEQVAEDRKAIRWTIICGALICMAGCGLAVFGSFQHPQNRFDCWTASVLLGLIAGGAIWLGTNRPNRWLPWATGALLTAFLWHSLYWNSDLAIAAGNLFTEFDVRGHLMLLIPAVVLPVCGFFARRKRPRHSLSGVVDSDVSSTLPIESFSVIAFFVQAVALFAAMLTVPHAIGFATGAAAIVMAASFLNALNLRQNEGVALDGWVLFQVCTLATSLFAVSEIGLRFGWFQSLTESRLLLMQMLTAAVWTALWLLIEGRDGRLLLSRKSRFHACVLYALPIVVVAVIAIVLSPGIHAELSKDATGTNVASAWLAGGVSWIPIVLAAVLFLHLLAMFVEANVARGVALVTLSLGAVAFATRDFEQNHATSSALRWLVPIGGFVLAALISSRRWYVWGWHRARRSAGLSGRATLVRSDRQQVVNWLLFLVAGIAILLSTATVSIALVQGGGALGGPLAGSLLGDLRKDVSFGVPVAIIVGTFLLLAISQRRSVLAIAGSCVFQYVVILSVVLLCISPHPKLASAWFINILQAVAIGMAGYGIVWFYFRKRVGESIATTEKPFRRLMPRHIELHSILNGVLLLSLLVLIVQQYFFHPFLGAGWIGAAGGPLGYLALAGLMLLAWLIWRERIEQNVEAAVALILLALTAMVATSVDKFSGSQPWYGFNTILVGSSMVAAGQALTRIRGGIRRDGPYKGKMHWEQFLAAPALGLTAIFSLQGAIINNAWFWWYLAPLFLLIVLLLVRGLLVRSVAAFSVAMAFASMLAFAVVFDDPHGWFRGRIGEWVNVQLLAVMLVSVVWNIGSFLQQRLPRESVQRTGAIAAEQRRFSLVPNIVFCVAIAWIILGSLADWVFAINTSRNPVVFDRYGLWMLGVSGALLIVRFWNRRAWLRFDLTFVWIVAVSGLVVHFATRVPSLRLIVPPLLVAIVSSLVAYGWMNGRLVSRWVKRWHVPRSVRLAREINSRLPIYLAVLAGVAILFGLSVLFYAENPVSRNVAAMTLPVIAFAMSAFASQPSIPIRMRWRQLVTLGLLVLGVIFLGWSQLTLDEISLDRIQIPMRTLLATTAGMFALGIALPKYTSRQSVWTRSIADWTVATCVIAIMSFAIMLAIEAGRYVPEIGCGLSTTTALGISLVVCLLIASLIVIAVRPRFDPLALSENGRKGYVYAAQVVAVMLLAHAVLSMPWLLQIGLRHYWPYIAMLVAFGGIAGAEFLKRRQLQVLAEPIFHAAAVLPVAGAIGVLATHSFSDPALVMLLGGMVYLTISTLRGSDDTASRGSMLWIVAAILFGNFALWLYYGKFPWIQFASNPQLWLIPPAISVIVAAQLNRESLSVAQLAMIRYVCVAIIYISSTSEIFIHGIGQELWPPMILALLAVAGMGLGMLLRVRAYLYPGTVFLLMAMVTMVSHAHQRLGHTWPWWAFGIGLGIVILTLFGLFEKRRNELRSLGESMRHWEM